MNIALIGSGGREHALCKKLKENKEVNKIFCIPGNAGTDKIAINLNINFLNFEELLKHLKKNKINLVVVGPEEPLVKGIVDFLEKNKIRVFGPNKYASKLEGSKSFVKTLCSKYNIPTAKFKICKNIKQITESLKFFKMPVVIKADGIAAGKGVIICNNRKQAVRVSEEIFQGKFKSSKTVLLEEFLRGEEASYFLIVDKKKFITLGSAQDHKKVGEKETGLNTGGMGAYSPAPIITKSLEEKILSRIVKPTLKALKERGKYYRGFLYVGLMIIKKNPYLIEYNVRMGDPECQVIIPRLRTNLLKILISSTQDKLNKLKIKWSKSKCMTIVLCSKGYPGKYKKNIEINNLEKVKENNKLFILHAGTKKDDQKVVSQGGRVLNVVALGSNLLRIRKKIIQSLKKINWSNGFFRKDIGWRIINKR